MDETEIKILALYISVWSWQILAIMFLVATFILFALPTNLSTIAFAIAFLIVFVVCEFFSLRRRKEFYHGS